MKMWICRDMDNTLWLSEGEPYLDEEKGEWNFRSGNYMNLSKEKYPEVTFENSPMEVELVIKKSEDETWRTDKADPQEERLVSEATCKADRDFSQRNV